MRSAWNGEISEVAVGDGYVVHALFDGRDSRMPGHLLVRVDRQTGDLSWLTHSGVSMRRSARISYVFRRIAGAQSSGEVLWLVVFESAPFATDAHDRPPAARDIPQYLSGEYGDGFFILEAYDLKTSQKIGQHAFPEEPRSAQLGVPFDKIEDDLGTGPLSATPDGISCFGASFRVANGQLESITPPAKG